MIASRARSCVCAILLVLLPACTKRSSENKGVVRNPAPDSVPTMVGTSACASCHEAEHGFWEGSHHQLAMQPVSPQAVLGDFEDATFDYYGEITRFSRKGDQYLIETIGPDAKMHAYPVKYVFGVSPLQQYLVETEPGRLQAFTVAWDTRDQASGGQRWFHLQPDEHIGVDDPLHWTAPSYNWNHACADCHSTAVEKNYARDDQRYSTEYFEINVGCEACHGPGSEHVKMAKQNAFDSAKGFSTHLVRSDERPWQFSETDPIARPENHSPTDELEACAPCHSRRAELGGGGDYHDRYRLALPLEPLYFADGQIRDEVFVYGSFLQSKMHAGGVVCSDCHEPHSLQLRATGNALCTRCHRIEAFDVPGHHFHTPGQSGSFCTDCHMSERDYMVIDRRADHGFAVPRPLVSERAGAPNACTGCHRDESARWAAAQIDKRVNRRDKTDDSVPPAIIRAKRLIELGDARSPGLPQALIEARQDPSPIVRRTVASAARVLPEPVRLEVVVPLLGDPSRSVRVEAVGAVLGSEQASWSDQDRAAFRKALGDYRASREHTADRGTGLVDLAYLALVEAKPEEAEQTLKEAIEIDPSFSPAYINLADLYRMLGRDREAEAVLRSGLEGAADRSAVEHALGLALVRQQRYEKALSALGRAHEAQPENLRYGYVYAVALFDRGRHDQALAVLTDLHDRFPNSTEVLSALVEYHGRAGHRDAAERYARLLKSRRADPKVGPPK